MMASPPRATLRREQAGFPHETNRHPDDTKGGLATLALPGVNALADGVGYAASKSA
jgi:hypothetical protein